MKIVDDRFQRVSIIVISKLFTHGGLDKIQMRSKITGNFLMRFDYRAWENLKTKLSIVKFRAVFGKKNRVFDVLTLS